VARGLAGRCAAAKEHNGHPNRTNNQQDMQQLPH
jgi:hypothetical protein